MEDKVNKWMEEISGGDMRAAPAKKWPARVETPTLPRQQTSQPLYDAVCAVCGKKTQVPFPPDPARPVFCKEHIGMAGRFKELTRPRQAPSGLLRPSAGEFVPRQAERTHQPFKRAENIQMLREALKKSLDAQKTKPEPAPAPKSNAGTLNPGEKIEL